MGVVDPLRFHKNIHVQYGWTVAFPHADPVQFEDCIVAVGSDVPFWYLRRLWQLLTVAIPQVQSSLQTVL